jgi:hypothetical protein
MSLFSIGFVLLLFMQSAAAVTNLRGQFETDAARGLQLGAPTTIKAPTRAPFKSAIKLPPKVRGLQIGAAPIKAPTRAPFKSTTKLPPKVRD